METFTFIVSIILVLLPISDWTATFILRSAAKKSNSVALKERRNVAGILALAVSLNAILATIRLTEIHIDGIWAVMILSASLLLISVPNLYWLSLFLRNRLHK